MKLYITENPKNVEKLIGKENITVSRDATQRLFTGSLCEVRTNEFIEESLKFFFVDDPQNINSMIISYIEQEYDTSGCDTKKVLEELFNKKYHPPKCVYINDARSSSDILINHYCKVPIHIPDLKMVIIPNIGKSAFKYEIAKITNNS